LENVRGLLSHDDGRTFKTIIAALVELGYCIEWQVLNSKNFGRDDLKHSLNVSPHCRPLALKRKRKFAIQRAEHSAMLPSSRRSGPNRSQGRDARYTIN